jgi:hypothetical protein
MTAAERKQAEKILEGLIAFIRSNSFSDFQMLHYHKIGEFPKSIEEVIDAVVNRVITPQDIFDETSNFYDLTDEEEDYWLDNINVFSYENYFPSEDKQAKAGGVWIKVKTKKGYQVHLAKKATRKHRFKEDSLKSIKQAIEELVNDKPEESKESNKKSVKSSVMAKIGLQPYELWYWRTKTQKAYVTPCEYEIVDIEEFINHAQSKNLKGIVGVRSLFTSQNQDKIFYLQSRGIPKGLAQIYANLGQCYFNVNIEEGWERFNAQWNSDENKAAIEKAFSPHC